MIYLRHIGQLLKHKWFVLIAGLRIGGIPLWRLVVHDLSKFHPAEFSPYARNFHGDYSSSPGDREEVEQAWRYAWLHHENRNPHHWGYWIPRSGRHANKPLPMPTTYVREMVADWMGAGRAYNGSWDMTKWLQGSLPNVLPHLFYPDTVGRLGTVLREQGYGDVFHPLVLNFLEEKDRLEDESGGRS